MHKNIVCIGDKLDLLSVNNSSGSQEKKIYKSQVLDTFSASKMQVAMPIEGFKILLLPIGGRYEASFYSNGGIYTCIIQIADRYKKRNQYVLDIELVTPLKKYQRREYYRLEYTMDIFYRPMTAEETEMEEEDLKESMLREDCEFFKAITADISGGGLRFVDDRKMHRGDSLVVKIPIEYSGGKKEIITAAKLLFSQNILSKRDKVEQRVEFTGMENRAREELIRFIFEKDRSNRKKEKR